MPYILRMEIEDLADTWVSNNCEEGFKMKTRISFSIALVFFCTLSALGAVPQQINYQGYLTDTDGNALDTTVAMTFILHTDSLAGSLLWTETRPSVTVSDGLFNVRLGQLTALDDAVFNNPEVWLSITVGDNSEMAPRSRIVSVGYSYRVGTVDRASGGTISGDVNIVGKANVGSGNTNPGSYAFVAGENNTTSGDHTTVDGGYNNSASGAYATVGGGSSNYATGTKATVGGGSGNFANSYAATVGGGYINGAIDTGATVAGGYGNYASARYATVAGGKSNSAGYFATVAGGGGNEASSDYGTVGGGHDNAATGFLATVGGGLGNTAGSYLATVSGGGLNDAVGSWATVGGGWDNNATGDYATVGGGWDNNATGHFSTVSGGANNTCSGDATFVCGNNAHAVCDSSFVFNDGRYDGNIGQTTQPRRFIAVASNGTYFYSNETATLGVALPANGTAWVAICDSTKKHRYGRVNGAEILDKVSRLPIETWSYKEDPNGIRHIGPMAQEFYALFGIGESDTTISTLDPDGIALAAIQELQKQNAELRAQNNRLQERLEKVEVQLQQLTNQKTTTTEQANLINRSR
jgi:hypothetical protein